MLKLQRISTLLKPTCDWSPHTRYYEDYYSPKSVPKEKDEDNFGIVKNPKYTVSQHLNINEGDIKKERGHILFQLKALTRFVQAHSKVTCTDMMNILVILRGPRRLSDVFFQPIVKLSLSLNLSLSSRDRDRADTIITFHPAIHPPPPQKTF